MSHIIVTMQVVLKKSIQNPPESPYLDWIKSGQKTFEGRLYTKIEEWGLLNIMRNGDIVRFYDQQNENSWVNVIITQLNIYPDFARAFDGLGDRLIPNGKRIGVIKLYNGLFHDGESLEYLHSDPVNPLTSEQIRKTGVVAIGIRVVSYSP